MPNSLSLDRPQNPGSSSTARTSNYSTRPVAIRALQYLPLLQMMLLNSMQHGGLFSASSDSSLPEGRLLLDAWAFHEHSYLCLVTFSKTRVPVASRDYSLSPRPLLEHRFGGVSEYTIYIFAYAKFSLDFNLLRCMLSENRSCTISLIFWR